MKKKFWEVVCLLFISSVSLGLSQVFGQVLQDGSFAKFSGDDRHQAFHPSPLFDLASPEEREFFTKAKDHFEKGRNDLALSYIKDFMSNHPETPLLPDALLLLSEVYVEIGQLNNAVETIETFLARFPDEPRLDAVQTKLSDIYFQRGDLEKILSMLEGIRGQETRKNIIYTQLAQAYMDRGEYLESLNMMMQRREISNDPIDRVLIQHEIELLIRVNLKEKALLVIVNRFGASYPADVAMIQMINLYDTKKDYYHEEREIGRFLSRFPKHQFVTQARILLDRIKNKIKSDRYLIAVVLPLSGRLVHFGNKALYGAEMAVQLFKEALPMASVGLVVRDVEENPSHLRMTFEAWLDEYSPIAVVGPLLSREVNRIAPLIEKAGLALITPGATARHLYSLGNAVYRNAVTNRFLCYAMAEYSVLQLSIERFAVLYPEEKLGQRWVDCFSKGVAALGGEVVLSESYPLDRTDFSKTILALKKADLEKDGFIEIIENEEGPSEKLYTPGFEALFLPADSVRAGLIIPQLFFHEFDEVKILGTNSWNTSEFLDLAGSYAEGVVLADGFFKGSSNPIVQGFVRQFRERFNEEPDLFAAQAFDATRLVLASLRGGAVTSQEVKAAIKGAIDFPGVSGFIYEILDGEVIKEPFFIEVQGGEFVQVN